MTDNKDRFDGAGRHAFIKAVTAGGSVVPDTWGGDCTRHRERILFSMWGFISACIPRSDCSSTASGVSAPAATRFCEDTVAFWSSDMLLAEQENTDRIVNTIFKVHGIRTRW